MIAIEWKLAGPIPSGWQLYEATQTMRFALWRAETLIARGLIVRYRMV